MQIHLTFGTDGLRLPMAHQYAIQAMIYHALDGDPGYQTILHDKGYCDGGRPFKAFTFSNLQGKYTAENGYLSFRGPVELEIRSADPRFMQLLLRHFDTGTVCNLLNNPITALSCRLDDRHILSSCIDIQMLSSVAAYRTEGTKTVFFSPADPEFYSMISTNAARKWESIRSRPIPESIVLTPLEKPCCYRKVVTRYKQTYITGWKGKFRLQGNPPVLDLLYQTGLGVKNSQGFGMFEVLDPSK